MFGGGGGDMYDGDKNNLVSNKSERNGGRCSFMRQSKSHHLISLNLGPHFFKNDVLIIIASLEWECYTIHESDWKGNDAVLGVFGM